MKDKTLSEVLGELENIGISVGPATIRNYWQKGLAPEPVKIGKGRSVESEYPQDMAAQVAASHFLITKYRMRISEAAKARNIALWIWNNTIRRKSAGFVIARDGSYNAVSAEIVLAISPDLMFYEDERLCELIGDDSLAAFLAGQWYKRYVKSTNSLYETEDHHLSHGPEHVFGCGRCFREAIRMMVQVFLTEIAESSPERMESLKKKLREKAEEAEKEDTIIYIDIINDKGQEG